MEQYDLIIRGARVIDAALDLDAQADICVAGDRIIKVGRAPEARGRREIDGRGLIASAGWIDLHVHCATGVLGAGALDADSDCGVVQGVTTIVDTGSVGAHTFANLKAVAEAARTRVLGYLNVSAHKNPTGGPAHGDWQCFDQGATIQAAVENRDILVGIKVLASQRHVGNLGIIPLQLGIQAAREAETGLMVHIGVAPPTIQEILNLLGPGDVITHCFKNYPRGLMNRKGRPVPEAWAALERGVLFDVGHGNDSFAWEAVRQALDAGFPCHSISTDLHKLNRHAKVYSLARTMAKFLHLGFSLPDVVRLVTLGPARALRREHEFGTLRPGSCADITVFRLKEGPVALHDSHLKEETGQVDIGAVYTVRAGRVVHGG